jgi:hypothetical protein
LILSKNDTSPSCIVGSTINLDPRRSIVNASSCKGSENQVTAPAFEPQLAIDMAIVGYARL